MLPVKGRPCHGHRLQCLSVSDAKLQESRVADGKVMAEKILTLVEESAGTSKETAIALDQVRDLLMKLTTNSQRKY